jgi:dTDP-3-amino-3,4,6-trideoxy-alpha-D-glucose transaminase
VTRPRIPCSAPAPREDAASVRAAVDRVLASGWFILGPEVDAFEAEFAAACGAASAVGVGNGTDAIAVILRALEIGPGDEVITSPLSAAYSALAIMMTGARAVFADVDTQTLTLDAAAVASAITAKTRAILPIHLYGQAADMVALAHVASRHGLALVEDCCQAHLATANGRPVGTIGIAGAFSFYPTKNLGALGDGGAVVTNDSALAERVRRIRNGGQTDRYHHEIPGVNSRLDEMQAAILRARLPFLPGWTAVRRRLASTYHRALSGAPVRVIAERDSGHVYHLFVVRSPRRDALQQHLRGRGIETLVHYPIPIPAQVAMRAQQPHECPMATAACGEVLSLPMYPSLGEAEIEDVAMSVASFPED